jgi:hypothetical protein
MFRYPTVVAHLNFTGVRTRALVDANFQTHPLKTPVPF